jgi:hypothetical protein
MHERVPQLCPSALFRALAPRRARQQQALDGAAGRHAPSEQPRGEHAGVVDDEEVAGAQVLRQAGDGAVLQARPFPREHHQLRRSARSWRLRDEVRGKVEVELGGEHPAGC